MQSSRSLCSVFAAWRLCASFILLGIATTVAVEPQVKLDWAGMRFVRIPAGEFLMGSPGDDGEADDDEQPQRRVRISRDFYLGQFEITQDQYLTVMPENPSWFSHQGGGRDVVVGKDVRYYPVENVSWDEATEFCRRLSMMNGRQPGKYRLPTESEWEYACRARTTTRFAYGNQLEASHANTLTSKIPQTRQIGWYEPNAWGLYDMHGNVWEWCSDHYAADAYQTAGINHAARSGDSLVVDPLGPDEGTGRVVRGGDYRFDARQARSANRDFTRQSRRDLGNGFRVVLMLDE